MSALQLKSIPFHSATLVATVLAAALGNTATAANELAKEPDGSWVSVKGTVVAKLEDSLILDYGEDTITVEVDSWDASDNADSVLTGYQITVQGRVDNDFYHERSIEADSIYVDELNTVLTRPTPMDEEEANRRMRTRYFGPIDNDIEVVGTVSGTSGREFTIDSGDRQVTVNTIELDYNPMDESGFQQIEPGDFVRASGELRSDTLESREMMAETVISLGKIIYDVPNGD